MTTLALPELAVPAQIPAHLRPVSSAYRRASAVQNQDMATAALNALHSTLSTVEKKPGSVPEDITRSFLLHALAPLNRENQHPAALTGELTSKAQAIVEALSQSANEADTKTLLRVLAQHTEQLVAA